MERKKIDDTIRKIMSEQMGTAEEKLLPTTDIVSDLGADSLDVVELTMEFEDEFDVDITDDEADKARTLADIGTVVEQKLTERGR